MESMSVASASASVRIAIQKSIASKTDARLRWSESREDSLIDLDVRVEYYTLNWGRGREVVCRDPAGRWTVVLWSGDCS